jgi:hypothetical protein
MNSYSSLPYEVVILNEPLPCPAYDVDALRLDQGQEAGRDLDFSQEFILWEL